MIKLIKYLYAVLLFSSLLACQSNTSLRPSVSLKMGEIIVALDFNNLTDSIIPKLMVIELESENYKFLQSEIMNISNWRINDTKKETPDIKFISKTFEILVYHKHVVFIDSKGNEMIGSLSDKSDFSKIEFTENDYDLVDFYGRGQIVNDYWTFCSTIALKNEYEYKKGKWKFWTKDFQYLGEGYFKIQKEKIEFSGGCPGQYLNYEILVEDSWKSNIQSYQLNYRTIELLQNSTPIKKVISKSDL